MKKSLLITLLTIFTLLFAASATAQISISSNVNLGTVTAGTQAEGTFEIDNNNNSNVDISAKQLNLTGPNDFNVNPNLQDNKVSNNTKENITFDFDIPSNQKVGDYSGTLTIADDDSDDTASTTVDVEVIGEHGLNIQGGNIQLNVDYSNIDEDENNVSVSQDITFENTGNYKETVTSNVTTDSDVKLSLDNKDFDLEPGKTKTVTLSGDVIHAYDSGTQDIGTLTTEYDSGNSELTKTVSIDVDSMLDLDDFDAEVDTGSDSETHDNLEDGDTIDEVSIDSDITLDFDLENLFDNDYGEGDIEDGEILVEIDDNDFGDDIDEDVEFDVDAGDDITETIEFTVPDDAEEGDYDMDVTIEGEDEEGQLHTIDLTIEVEIELEDDDVRIDDINLVQDTLSCTRNTRLDVRVKNFGADDQDDVELSVANQDLGLNERESFSLEEASDSDNDERRSINIDATNAETGNYRLDTRVYINGDDLMDSDDVTLTVEECDRQTDDETDETDDQTNDEPEVIINQTNPTPSVPSEQPSQNVTTSVEVPFYETNAFLGILALANLIVIAGIIFLIGKFLV